jgi:hypothetical protein
MPWQVGAKKNYYYESQRVGGKVVRRYFGSGPAAELAATASDLRQLQRELALRQAHHLTRNAAVRAAASTASGLPQKGQKAGRRSANSQAA